MLLLSYNDSILKVNIFFERRDKHLIEFLKSMGRYDPYPDIDISIMQPVHLYSSIEGGYGLVYASSNYSHKIDVSEWYSDPAFLGRLNGNWI